MPVRRESTTGPTRCTACRWRDRFWPGTARPKGCGRASTCRHGASLRGASSPLCWRLQPPMPRRLPEYAVRNREVWTVSNANYTAATAHDSRAQDKITCGRRPTTEAGMKALAEVEGRQGIHVGCGTADIG